MERDACPGTRVVNIATTNRVGTEPAPTSSPEHRMLEDHGAVLSRLFALSFTSAFLGAVLEHDYETHRHMLNVGLLCARVAITAGLSRDEAVVLGQAGLFHDIGKLHVRGTLLNARYTLSEAEWRILRAHAARGEQMLRAQDAHAHRRDRARASRTPRRFGLSGRVARVRDTLGDAAARRRRRVRCDALRPTLCRRDPARRGAGPFDGRAHAVRPRCGRRPDQRRWAATTGPG